MVHTRVCLKDPAFISFQSKGITIILSFARKLYDSPPPSLYPASFIRDRIIRRGGKIHCVCIVSRESGSSIFHRSSNTSSRRSRDGI